MSVSHVTYVNESGLKYEWVCQYMNVPRYEWVMSHTSMRHVTCVDESGLKYEWVYDWFISRHIVISHMSMRHESYVTCQWVMSHMSMSHVSHVNESCHIVISHMSMRHESYLTCQWVMSHMSMSHVSSWIWRSHISHVSWFISVMRHICEMWHTHSYLGTTHM